MLRQLSFAMRVSRALYAGVELGIADILASGAQTSIEIAARTGTHAPTLRRLLRALVAYGVFEETGPGHFSTECGGGIAAQGCAGIAARRRAFHGGRRTLGAMV
jgi:hypothetical protein